MKTKADKRARALRWLKEVEPRFRGVAYGEADLATLHRVNEWAADLIELMPSEKPRRDTEVDEFYAEAKAMFDIASGLIAAILEKEEKA